jgi:Domain of unknown function (DUF6285)
MSDTPEVDLHGRPTAGELVEAVIGFLRDEVSAELDARFSYQLRIAIHALEVVGRELELGPAQLARHQSRLAALGVPDDAALAAAIRAGRLPDTPAVREALRADTRDRLLVANPKWLPPDLA